MITSLSLINFRKHRSLEVSFGPGLNLICGPNWVGKTTVLSAIAYGLFGTKATPGTADQLVTMGEKAMSVIVEFTANERNYRVVRSLKTATLHLVSGKGPVATGHSPVTQEIEDLLGVSAKDFLSFYVTRQKEAASLLSLGSAKLNEYVTKVTGMDLVDRVLEKAKEELLKANAAVTWAGQAAQSEEVVALLESAVDDLGGSVTRLMAELGLAQQHCDSLAPALQEAQEALRANEGAYLMAEAGRRAAAVAEGVLKAATAQLEHLRASPVAPPQGDYQAEAGKLREMTAQLTEKNYASQEVGRLNKKREEAATAIAGWEAALQQLPEVNTAVTLQASLDTAREYEQAAAAAKQAEAAYTNSECPYCMRPFEGADQEGLRQALQSAMDALYAAEKADAVASEVHMETVERKKARGSALDALAAWEAELETVQAGLAKWEPALAVPVSLEAVQEQDRLVAAMKEGQRQFDLFTAEVTKWEREERSAQEKHAAELEKVRKGVTHAALTKVRTQEAELNEQMTKASLRLARLEKDLNATQSLLNQQTAELARAKESLGQLRAVTQRRDNLADLAKFLRSNRDRFTVSVWEQLLAQASQFVSEATGGDVTALVRGADGEFSYEEGGVLREVEGNASGMQETIFSTAVKLSLAAALGSRFSTYLFDEVTAAAADDTSLTFLGRLATAGSQVLLVTHRPADAAVADRLIQL